MRAYIGAKVVCAEPQDKNGVPGYKVVYADNYISWSPKEVFEEAYRPISKGEEALIESPDLQGLQGLQQDHVGQSIVHGDFFDRLTNERADLDARLTALNSYLSHNPGHPNPRHHEMLCRQAIAMSEYLVILDERIADIQISRRSELTQTTTAHPNEDAEFVGTNQ